MGVVDDSGYSDGDLVAGNAKVLGHCATNAVESACDIVGGCCKIAWYCGEAAWSLGKGLVGLFR
jgi:hypothetical protein